VNVRVSTLCVAIALVMAIGAIGPAKTALAIDLQPTTTVYLPNVTRMLGGPDGWNTPFIVQNVGTASTNLTFEFRRFSDGAVVKTRTVAGLAPGTSVFHCPNCDDELAAGGQYSVVIKSFGSPVVAVVNEHQNEANAQRQEALSYDGLTFGSTKVYLPYVAALAGGFYCTVIAQNLGTALASATADFKSFDGLKSSQVARTIVAGGSQFIDPRFEPNLTAGTEYAVTFTSTQPLGVVVNCHNDDASNPAPRAFSYNGVRANSEIRTFAPYVAKNVIGRTSRVIVQNAGTTPAQPVLHWGSLGGPITTQLDGPAAVAPGAVWTYDFGTAATLPDGERSIYVSGGEFAVLVDTRSPTTAMGYTGGTEYANRVYLPNITRTLGGSSGWTTPIIVQSQDGWSATMKWYRFADGVLVHTQLLSFGFLPGMSIKVDPRSIPQLTDDTQYAVIVEASRGGVGAIVLELNDRGGDSAMAYEGMVPSPSAPFGTSSCSPTSDVSGSSFICRFYGLPAGATPITYSITVPGQADFTEQIPESVAPDGSYHVTVAASALGFRTVTVTAGGISKSASFTVNSPTFGVQITQSQNGAVTATTKPGAACIAYAQLPDKSFVASSLLVQVKVADAVGKVSWTYPTQPGAGTSTHFVECMSSGETHVASAPFNLP
jgi:hypothetical protein